MKGGGGVCVVGLLLLLLGVESVGLGGFTGFGDAGDEADEAVAVGLGWDGGDLGFRVGEAFPKVFGAFDNVVLHDGIDQQLETSLRCVKDLHELDSQ